MKLHFGEVLCEIRVSSSGSDVHSGVYGGAVVNAVHQLMALVRKVVDENNQVKLPGFYDQVDPVDKMMLENNRKLMELGGDPVKEAGFRGLRLGKGCDFYTATGLYPTVQVTGFKSGYVKTGFANIVPAKAEVRLNFRLVSSQKAVNV